MEPDYKKMIIEMVSKINNKATLKYIYTVICAYLKSRGI